MHQGLHLLALARSDIAQIWAYTAQQWGEAQADRYIGALYATCEKLAESPSLGHRLPELNSPVRSYRHAQHRIFYLVEPSRVVFLAFLHERMDRIQHLPERWT